MTNRPPMTQHFAGLQVIEIFDYYDGPRLFACRDLVGTYILVMWVREQEMDNHYWAVQMSYDRFLIVRSGGMSLDRVFLNPESGLVSLINVSSESEQFEVHQVKPSALDATSVPDSDEYIERPTETLPDRFSISKLTHKAIASQRELIGLHFEFPGLREEAPTKSLGRILVSVQDTLDALGQNAEGHPTMRGMIPPDLLARTETTLVQASGGSFAIEISAAETVNLFGESLVTDALNSLVELLEIGADAEVLREKLLVIKPRAVTKYKALLSAMIAAHTPLHLDWASPNITRNKSVDFSLSTAASALATAEAVSKEAGERITGTGIFVGVELPRKTFTLVMLDNEDSVYRGRIANEAMFQAEHLTLNNPYSVAMRENIEITSSGEEKTKYILESIEEVDSQTPSL